jgi:hypothetical protein
MTRFLSIFNHEGKIVGKLPSPEALSREITLGKMPILASVTA